jgi:peptide subunit release factor 1 (eRF1)
MNEILAAAESLQVEIETVQGYLTSEMFAALEMLAIEYMIYQLNLHNVMIIFECVHCYNNELHHMRNQG